MKLIKLLSGLIVSALLLSGCVPATVPAVPPETAPAPTAEPAPIETVCISVSAFDGNKLTAAAGEFENGVFTPSGAAVELTVTEGTEFISCSAADLVKNAVFNAETQSGTALVLELLYAPAPAITAVKNGSAATLVTEPAQLSGEYTSESDDENALRIDGVTASLSDATVTKSGGECTDPAAAAYGMNAALLAQNAATLAIVNSNIASLERSHRD